jgi:hypothetical protein
MVKEKGTFKDPILLMGRQPPHNDDQVGALSRRCLLAGMRNDLLRSLVRNDPADQAPLRTIATITPMTTVASTAVSRPK